MKLQIGISPFPWSVKRSITHHWHKRFQIKKLPRYEVFTAIKDLTKHHNCIRVRNRSNLDKTRRICVTKLSLQNMYVLAHSRAQKWFWNNSWRNILSLEVLWNDFLGWDEIFAENTRTFSKLSWTLQYILYSRFFLTMTVRLLFSFLKGAQAWDFWRRFFCTNQA